MSLPYLRLKGPPHAQGHAHGEALRDRIRHNLEVYRERFALENAPWPGVLERAALYLPYLEQHHPGYAAGMRAIAAASGAPLEAIAALNLRYEILYYQFTRNLLREGCTSFAALPETTRDGHLLMGQNWDWFPEVAGAVVRTTEPDGLETLGYTEAGILGAKIGLNSAGVGVGVNGLTSTADAWDRRTTPFHVRLWRVLRARTFNAAVAVVTDEPRACSMNLLIGQAPDRVVNLEAAPDRVHRLTCQTGCLTHANHFTRPEALGITEPPDPHRPHSITREARLRALLLAARPLTVEKIQRILQDGQGRPWDLCRHALPGLPPDERYATVVSVVMNLTTRTLHLADGPPCTRAFQTHRL